MTPTSVLPDHVATDVSSRSALQNLGDGSGGDQDSKFPELLGRLMVHQASDQPAKTPSAGSGDGAAAGAGQPPLPWKFRIGDGLALAGRADAAVTATAGSQPLIPVVGGEISPGDEHFPVEESQVVNEFLAGVQGSRTGEDAGSDNAQVPQADLLIPAATQPLSTDVEAILAGARLTALVESSVHTAAAASDAYVSTGMKGRRAGLPTEIATTMTSRAGIVDPMAKTVADRSQSAAVSVASVEFDGASASQQLAKDREVPAQVLGETKITVLRTETHLPPAGHILPMHQIAERIEAQLGSGESAEIRADSASFPPSPVKPESAVKVLHIQLQPAELGTVTVRLSLRGDALDVQLEVSRQDTAHLLRQDREALSKILHSAGYALDGLAVHVVESDRTASTTQFGTQGNNAAAQSSAQSPPDWSQPEGRHSGMQQQGQREERHSSAQSDAAINAGAGARTPNGAVYL